MAVDLLVLAVVIWNTGMDEDSATCEACVTSKVVEMMDFLVFIPNLRLSKKPFQEKEK